MKPDPQSRLRMPLECGLVVERPVSATWLWDRIWLNADFEGWPESAQKQSFKRVVQVAQKQTFAATALKICLSPNHPLGSSSSTTSPLGGPQTPGEPPPTDPSIPIVPEI